MPRDQVFISYSHKDKKWRDDLDTHLKPYLRGGSIVGWSDQQIAPGSEWFREIQSALSNSKVAVLLVSSDFLASDFIHEHELGPLLKEAEQGGVKILWVSVYDSAYKKTALKNYQAVLDPGKPLGGMTKAKRGQAWVKICEEIEKAVTREDATIDEAKDGPSDAGENIRNQTHTVRVIQVKDSRDAEGFYTEFGVRQLIDETSGLGERWEGAILIYKTQKQHTWLVATCLKLYCIVDDFNRRKSGQLIQWSMLLHKADPVKIRDSDKPNSGFLNIGQRKDWYYSKRLFPTDGALIEAIKRLILQGKLGKQEEEIPLP